MVGYRVDLLLVEYRIDLLLVGYRIQNRSGPGWIQDTG